MNDLLVFFGLIAVLFLAWFMNDGYKNNERTSGKFIEPAAPLDGGRVYDEKIFGEWSFFNRNRDSETK